MTSQDVVAESNPALETAADVITSQDDAVVAYMAEILGGASKSSENWGSRQTSSALKMLSSHVEGEQQLRILELESKERTDSQKLIPWVALVGFAGTLVLSWLFLEYEKPEFILAIITGIFGFAGGYGASSKWGKNK